MMDLRKRVTQLNLFTLQIIFKANLVLFRLVLHVPTHTVLSVQHVITTGTQICYLVSATFMFLSLMICRLRVFRFLCSKYFFCRITLASVLAMLTALATDMYWIHLPVYTNNFNMQIDFFRNKINVDQYVEKTVVNNSKVYTPAICTNVSKFNIPLQATHKHDPKVYTPPNLTNDKKVNTPTINTKSFNNRSSQHLDLKTKEFTTELHDKKVAPVSIEHKDSQIPSKSREPLQMPNTTHSSKTTHVAFLKVHKAGSSTMQNLFFRFGMKHNLNILLPRRGNYLASKSYQMQIQPTQHFDIFACHTIYSSTLFNSLLPADSVKIGIVREPVDRMISAAYYYRDVWRNGYLMRVPRANFIHNLVRYPELYERSFFSNTRNAMGRDFGFRNTIKQSDTEQIHQYLKQLNSEFMLVLTVEKMDESLVLMRRLLHWSISDIIYLKVNKHGHSPVLLTEEEKSTFKNTSFLDFEVYNYFKAVLDRRLQFTTKDFWEEVKHFRLLLRKVGEFCQANSSEGNRKDTLLIEKSAWNENFNILGEECKWMSIHEPAFINKLRIRHIVMQSNS